MPSEWQDFLDQFGISGTKRIGYFRYSPDLDRLTFSVGPNFVEARSLDKEPKVLSWGKKPTEIFWQWPQKGSPLLFVEDVFSTFMIADSYACACLFGSQWLQDWDELIERYNYHPIFWLDKDKLDKAREYRDMWRSRGRPSTLIFTPKDPKHYFNYQIKEFVNKAITSLNLPKPESTEVRRWNPVDTRMEDVPADSLRARLWLDHVPDCIPQGIIVPNGTVIRFNNLNQLVFVQVESPEYYYYNSVTREWAEDHEPLQTRFNNPKLAMEEFKVKKMYENILLQDIDPSNEYIKNWEASYQKLKKSLGSNTQTTNKNKPTKINKPNTTT